MECGIVSDVAFWQVLCCEHIIILFWYVRNVRTGREERIGKEKLEMGGRLAKAVEIIPVTRVSDVVKWGRLYLIL